MVRQVVPPRVDAELKRQVAYLGNNLNQLTKLAHEHHQIGNLTSIRYKKSFNLLKKYKQIRNLQ